MTPWHSHAWTVKQNGIPLSLARDSLSTIYIIRQDRHWQSEETSHGFLHTGEQGKHANQSDQLKS